MAATKVGDPPVSGAIRYSSPLFSVRQLDELRTKDGCSSGVDIYDSNP